MSTTQGQQDSGTVSASCPDGTQLLGGGATAGSQEADIISSGPGYSSGQTNEVWSALFNVQAANAEGDTFQIYAFAYCGNIGS